MEKKNISISKKARYFQLGKISEQTKTIWFVFHGYGMLSQYFIKKFKNLENNQTVIISPEALSRFYIGKNYDRVGASWITKEDKLNDIDDNNNYLNSLFESTTKNINLNSINIHVLGFSQGGAAACRWILNSNIKINSLGLWGADIPIDCLSEIIEENGISLKQHLLLAKKMNLFQRKIK